MDTARKAKNCAICNQEFYPFKTTDKWCSLDCSIEYGLQKAAEKRKKAYDAETRRLRREQRANDRGYQLSRAQAAFNAYIRARDAGKPCISCGSTTAKPTAGHYRTVGAHPELRFEPDNCHVQCWYNCNMNKSGNIIEYRKGLIERIGIERVEWLEGYHEPANLSLDDIKEITRKYKAMTKALKND